MFCFFVPSASSALAQQSPVITEKELLRIAPRPANQNRLTPNPNPASQTETYSAEDRRQATEDAWAIRLRIAQAKAKELERRADATELDINRLNNVLFSGEPRPSKTHKELIAGVADQTTELRRLRAEAQLAKAEVENLLDEGAAAGFNAYSSATATQLGSGVSSNQYFRNRYLEVKNDLLDAERRAAVLQLRINDLSRRILLNSGTGDEFYNTRLRDLKSDAELELSDAQSRIGAVTRRLEELRRQARAAGIYLNL
jgi:hypothetical protein